MINDTIRHNAGLSLQQFLRGCNPEVRAMTDERKKQ
jgi:hypothetical protein